MPDQISKFWSIIKYGIEESLPPIASDKPDRMNRMLMSLLSDKAQCWVSYTKHDESRKLEAVLITRVLYDDVSDNKNLLIYCLYGYEDISRDSWTSGFKSLVKYADSIDCARIIAYTDIPSIVDHVVKLGGDTRYTFISLPL